MSERYGTPMNYPALMGVYLAVNALRDAFVLVDGPDCAFYKAHFIHGRHDLNSTLLRVDGRHRVAFTNVCSRGVVKDHDDIIAREIARLSALPEAGLVLVTALPMCSITGVDYGRVIRSRAAAPGAPALDIPPESLVGDWLDGYARTLHALAKSLPLAPRAPGSGRVALVGYLMDRNEGDHAANLAELSRLLGGLSLELASTWLGGQGAGELSRAGEADLVVSLPYGRAAARRLAERSGATLVETVLPFGLPRTVRFLRDVAAAAGRAERAEGLIDRELARAAPRLQWIIPQRFLERRAAFVGDPHLFEGFRDIAEELGLRLEGAVLRARRPSSREPAPPGVHYEPPARSEAVTRLLDAPLDLLVSSWCGQDHPSPRAPVLEFGFPSYRHHALSDRPFLGFEGALAFVERMADAISPPAARGDG